MIFYNSLCMNSKGYPSYYPLNIVHTGSKMLFFNSYNQDIASAIRSVCYRVDQTIEQSFSGMDGVHKYLFYFPITLFVHHRGAGGDRG